MSFLDKLKSGIQRAGERAKEVIGASTTRVALATILGAGAAAVSPEAKANPIKPPTILTNKANGAVHLGLGYQTSGLQKVTLATPIETTPTVIETRTTVVVESRAPETTSPKPQAKVGTSENKPSIPSPTPPAVTPTTTPASTMLTTEGWDDIIDQWKNPNEEILDATEYAVLEEGVNVAPSPDQGEETSNNTEALAARVESNSATLSPLVNVDLDELFTSNTQPLDSSKVVVPNASGKVADQYNLFLAGLAGAGAIAAGAAALRRRRQEEEWKSFVNESLAEMEAKKRAEENRMAEAAAQKAKEAQEKALADKMFLDDGFDEIEDLRGRKVDEKVALDKEAEFNSAYSPSVDPFTIVRTDGWGEIIEQGLEDEARKDAREVENVRQVVEAYAEAHKVAQEVVAAQAREVENVRQVVEAYAEAHKVAQEVVERKKREIMQERQLTIAALTEIRTQHADLVELETKLSSGKGIKGVRRSQELISLWNQIDTNSELGDFNTERNRYNFANKVLDQYLEAIEDASRKLDDMNTSSVNDGSMEFNTAEAA